MSPHPTAWSSILILSSHLRMSSKLSLSLRFPHQNPVRTPHLPIRATCPAGFIIIHFITRLIFGERYEAWRSSLYNFPQSTVTSSLRGPHISVSTSLAHPQPISLPHIKYKILYLNYGRLGDKYEKSQDWTSCDMCTLPFVRALARQIRCGLHRTGYCPPSEVLMNQGLQHIIHAHSYWLLT
jgi:hypothetical protein